MDKREEALCYCTGQERGLITWVGGKLRREGVSSVGRGPSASYNRLSS